MRPIGTLVFVTPDDHKEEVVGGIVLNTANAPKLQIQAGTVQAVGPGALHIKQGDRVWFDRYAETSHRATLNGKEAFFLREDDILAILT